jgi:ferrochelatase
MALRAPLTRAANRATSTAPTFALQWRRGNATVAPVPAGSKGPTAMVFMNMGGPSTTDEVHGFLSALFVRSDPQFFPELQPNNDYRLTRT